MKTVAEQSPRDSVASGEFAVWDATDAQDRDAWLQTWRQWPRQEIFAHPGYQELAAAGTGAAAKCAVLRSDNGDVMFPFLLRSLDDLPFHQTDRGAAFDVSTHGYVGPFCSAEPQRGPLADRFWTCYDQWARAQGVVCEFVRMTLFADQILAYPGTQANKLNIVRSLELDDDALWADVRHKVRKNVKRARSVGLTVEVDDDARRLDDFLRIYLGTMDRRDVPQRDAETADYFTKLCQSLAGNYAFLHVLHEGEVVSSELALFGAENIYSFLGGTDSRYFDSRPNDLLKYELIRWARDRGLQNLVLGGGRAPNDGIYRYKESFAPNGAANYTVGWRVLRPDAYDALTSVSPGAGQGDYSPNDCSTFFPAYRRAA